MRGVYTGRGGVGWKGRTGLSKGTEAGRSVSSIPVISLIIQSDWRNEHSGR